jgi:prefoldin alpha subunit
MAEESMDEESQQMASFLQAVDEQLKELDMQRQVVDQGSRDIAASIATLEKLENEPANDEGEISTIMPVGSAAFIRTAIKKPSSYIVSIGARYYVEQDFEACKQILNSQQEKMTKTRELIEQRIKMLVEQAEKVRPALEQRINGGAPEAAEANPQASRPRAGKASSAKQSRDEDEE